MSITKCPYCDKVYDQDFEVEHEEVCQDVTWPTDKQMAKLYYSSKNTPVENLVSKLRAKYLDKLTASELIGFLDKEQWDMARVKLTWILDDNLGDVVDINLANESR